MKAAPPSAVVEEFKKYFRNPKVLDEWNKGRHEEDQIKDYVEWIAVTKFGVSIRTIYNRLKEAGVSISSIKRRLNDLDVDKTIDVYDLEKFQPIYYTLDIPVKKHIEETKVLLISDIQAGAIRGINKIVNPYDYVNRYFEKLKEQIRKEFEIRVPQHLIITLLGDLVDGENIFLNQEVIPVQEQVVMVANVIYDLIQMISAYDVKIDVYSVRGNHGRISKYHKQSSNWDNIIYEMLYIRYDTHHRVSGNATNVTIYRSNSTDYVTFPVGKWTFMLHHGDFVRGLFNKSGELNTQPIENKMKQMKLSEHPHLDALLIGHWHKFHFGEIFKMQYVINGTSYESEFVRNVLNGRETLAFCYLTVGDEMPISDVKLLYLGDYDSLL